MNKLNDNSDVSHGILIESDPHPNWAAILRLNESEMVTKAHDAREQVGKKALGRLPEASARKVIPAATC